MTIEDVDWLLRYPADELVMASTTLTRIGTAIASARTLAEGIKYRDSYDESHRLVRVPTTLAGRKLTLNPIWADGQVKVCTRGTVSVDVTFPTLESKTNPC